MLVLIYKNNLDHLLIILILYYTIGDDNDFLFLILTK